jgi:regulator of protease activity HflC (stomatin/prohibitin superfamily)
MTAAVIFLMFGVPPMARKAFGKNAAEQKMAKTVTFWGRISLGLLWGVLTVFASFQEVSSGHLGVVKNFGNITGQINPGFHVITPWSTVTIQSTQVGRIKYDKIEAFSKETQNVYIAATLNSAVSPDAIQNLMRTVGPDYQQKLIDARVLNYTKEESVKYSATDVAPNREVIRTAVRERLKTDLAPYSITVIDFLIDNISFDPAFEQSILDKQVATQEAQKAQAQVAQKTAEAQQAVETAKGAAEANRQTAAGDADAITTRANAQAAANAKIAASLTSLLIQQEGIDKLNPAVKVIVVPAGSVNVNNLGDLINSVAPTTTAPTAATATGK